MIQKLARDWMTDGDWRTCEADLNALSQFITEIDGLDIHFIHVRSQQEMPGYGFSGKPTRTGWGPERMGQAWAELMSMEITFLRPGAEAYVFFG